MVASATTSLPFLQQQAELFWTAVSVNDAVSRPSRPNRAMGHYPARQIASLASARRARGLPLLLATLAGVSQALANVPCELGSTCGAASRSLSKSSEHRPATRAADLDLSAMRSREEPRQSTTFTTKEYAAFSGIGAVVCNTAAGPRVSTAFLVGGFDIAVTVAQTFMHDGSWVTPAACFYASVGPVGQIRECIPLSSIKTQWQTQPDTLGQATSDLAVVRLRGPVRLAQRTMSLTKFGYRHAPVVLVGFRPDLGVDARKRKASGRVYPRPAKSCVRFAHDVDSRNVSPGAPLIDIRDGVVIGLHTTLAARRTGRPQSCGARGNIMIMMNDWLEQTLRAEIASGPAADTIESAAGL